MLAFVHRRRPATSGATYSPIPIKQRLLRDQRRAKIIALAGVTAFSAMLVALVLVLDGGDSPTTATDRPPVQPNEPTITQERAPGVRYDGGPEEGSRGRLITSSNGSLSVPPFPGVRYDGGPEEGSADVSPSHGR